MLQVPFWKYATMPITPKGLRVSDILIHYNDLTVNSFRSILLVHVFLFGRLKIFFHCQKVKESFLHVPTTTIECIGCTF